MPHLRALIRRVLVSALLLFLFLGSPAWSYVVYLKDGSQVVARDKYRVDGDLALLVLRSGVTTSIPLAEIDIARTEAENTTNLGTAIRIEGLEKVDAIDSPPPPAAESRPTISTVLQQRGDAGGGLRYPEARQAVVDRDAQGSLPRTKAGYLDLLRLPRQRFADADADLAVAVRDYLRGQGLSLVEIYQGSDEDKLLVEIVANAEPLVFQAVAESARALIQIRQQFPDQIDAFEVLLLADATSRSARSGQFLIDAELAELLSSGEISPPAFFLRYVEF